MSLKPFQFLQFAFESAKRSKDRVNLSKKQVVNIFSFLEQNNVPFNKNHKILEIGGGIGNFLAYSLVEKDYEVISIDVYETRISFINAIKSLFNNVDNQVMLLERIKNFIRILFYRPCCS